MQPSLSLFEGRTVFITGASSGLGLALARAFVRAQANVVLVARSREKLEAAATSLDAPAERVLAIDADVASQEQMQDALSRATRRFGAVHIVVSCAGQGLVGQLADTPIELVRECFDINFVGALHLVRAALPELRKQHGHLVVVSSSVGLRALPRGATYAASKYALLGLAESLRSELCNDGIHVLSVCPGRLNTPFVERTKSVDGKKMLRIQALDPDPVARRILDAIRGRERLLIIPFSARFLHWANLWCPRLVDHFVLKRYQKEGLL